MTKTALTAFNPLVVGSVVTCIKGEHDLIEGKTYTIQEHVVIEGYENVKVKELPRRYFAVARFQVIN